MWVPTPHQAYWHQRARWSTWKKNQEIRHPHFHDFYDHLFAFLCTQKFKMWLEIFVKLYCWKNTFEPWRHWIRQVYWPCRCPLEWRPLFFHRVHLKCPQLWWYPAVLGIGTNRWPSGSTYWWVCRLSSDKKEKELNSTSNICSLVCFSVRTPSREDEWEF